MVTIRTALATLVLFVFAACTSPNADPTTTLDPGTGGDACPSEGEEMETAMLYIEHNATDGDTGVHGNFGGEPWTSLCLRDPVGEIVLEVRPRGALGTLGLSDFFFESREPANDELAISDLLGAFPEGEYLVGAVGQDQVARVATALFTHDIPAEPNITAPELADEEESAGDAIVDGSGLTVSWEPVVETIGDDDVDITGYQVIITKIDHDDPNGFSRPVYDVHLPPGATTVDVPGQFLEEATRYELEVLAIEVSGNQTIALGFFATR